MNSLGLGLEKKVSSSGSSVSTSVVQERCFPRAEDLATVIDGETSAEDFSAPLEDPSCDRFVSGSEIFHRNNLVCKVSEPTYDRVVERHDVIRELGKSLLGPQTCKVFLQGDFFTGKKSIVLGLAQKISENLVPLRLRNFAILDVCGLLADLQLLHRPVFISAKRSNLIYFIRNMDVFTRYLEDVSFVSEDLYAEIKRPEVPVIAIGSANDNFTKYIRYGDCFWKVISVGSPPAVHIKELLQMQSRKLSLVHGCEFSEAALEKVQSIAKISRKEMDNLSLIYRCFIILDRIAADFDYRCFENPEALRSEIFPENVVEAAQAILPQGSPEQIPSYIS